MTWLPVILALDPGYTTGFAVIYIPRVQIITAPRPVSDVGELRSHRAASGATADRFLRDALVALRTKWRPEHVIIERLPRTLDKTMQQVVAIHTDVFESAQYVSPGEWKPVANRWALPRSDPPIPAFVSQHAKDAYRMGCYWLMKQGL